MSRSVEAKLSAAVRELCVARPRVRVAAAESLTCGRVQALLGAAAGASDFFVGGITTYTIAQKVAWLGVEARAARRVNAVSAEVAVQMARGAIERFGAHIAVATTGYAGADAAAGVDVPYAWWALVHARVRGEEEVRSGRVFGEGLDREEMQAAVALVVGAELRDYLKAWRAGEGR